jgi:hypothetical protein
MATTMHTSAEQIRVTQEGGGFLCRIETRLTSLRDNGHLLSVSGQALICTLDSLPARGHHDNYHTPIEVATFGTGWLLRSGGGDFQIPLRIRGLGVARVVWSRLYTLLPQELKGKVRVKGILSVIDSTPINSARRDTLWKDVCGFSMQHPEATFSVQSGKADGSFSGILHDPWNPTLSSLRWQVLATSESEA